MVDYEIVHRKGNFSQIFAQFWHENFKDLSKIPMPVNFNEPLSMLQRITEDFEYYKILDKAAAAETTEEQVALVAAFSVSSYASTLVRTTKPFNPLLGETYELDRVEEMGLRLIVEQGKSTLYRQADNISVSPSPFGRFPRYFD